MTLLQRISALLLFNLACPFLPAAQSPDIPALEASIEQAHVEWRVPGLSVAIVKDDQVVLSRGFGVRELGKDEKVDGDTLFAIASNTKAFTAAALAILVDEGRLSWDDRVRDRIPYFKLYAPYVTEEMRIRDLLCHRSGLGTFSGDLLWYLTSYNREDVIRRAAYLEPAGAFRASYGYSNIMFIAAGEVIPGVSGKTWEDFVSERILNAIGMRRSVVSVKRLSGMANIATPHADVEGDLTVHEWAPWDTTAAAGGIISCANDMARWIRLQLNSGTIDGIRVFSETASRTMWTPHNSIPLTQQIKDLFPSTHFREYGLGWNLQDYRGRLLVSHGGAYDGMFSRVVMMPEERLGLVILTNSTTSIQTALAFDILDTFLAVEDSDWSRRLLALDRSRDSTSREQWRKWEATRLPDTKTSLPLEQYTGVYGGPLYGDARISLEDGHLVLRLLPAPDLTADLSHWDLDTFEVRWRKHFPWFGRGKLQFLMDNSARVTEFKLEVPNEDFWFHELEFKKKD